MAENDLRAQSQQTGSRRRCAVCGAEFRTQTELEQHKTQAHPTK